jgi:uncharacterized membrane protein
MSTNKHSTSVMIQLALLIAIMIVMAMVPFLGYIPLTPTIRATTIHIPVIIGAILLGPKAGALLGGVFGLTSLVTNTINGGVTAFVFTPFYQLGDTSGNFWSLVICFVPRILIGVVAGYLYRWIQKIDKSKIAACTLAGIFGSLTNTILVMGGIYLFFGKEYAQAKEIAFNTLLKVIGGVIAVNGVLEAVVAAVIATLVARPLLSILGKRGMLPNKN